MSFHVAPDPMPAQAEEHIKTIDEISNLATSAAADRTAVSELTTTNAALVKELDSITEKLVTSKTKVTSFTQQLYYC